MTDTQPTLGEFLRQERERKGITIEQVASATKISVRLLHLLESDQYVELPAKPFIRGFVNSYCRFIGIDPKEVLIRYGAFLEEHSHDRPTRDEGHSGYAFEKREGEQSRMILSIVMGAFLVLGAIVVLVLKPSLHRHHNSRAERLRQANPPVTEPSPSPSSAFQLIPIPSTAPSVLVFSPSPSPSASRSARPEPEISLEPTTTVPLLLRPVKIKPKPSPKPTPKASKAEKVAPAPSASPSPAKSERPDPLNSGINLKGSEIKFKVVFKTSADVWVRYQDDDRPMMKFILRNGKVLVLRAQKEIRFQSSDPNAITFRVNGGPIRTLAHDPNVAPRGKDLTLLFPKELVETLQDPFPGQRPLLGSSVPAPWRVRPSPKPSP